MPSTTFTTAGWSAWTVPTKVTSVTVTLDGAGSGTIPGSRVTGKLAVTPGTKLYCHAGGLGRLHTGSTGGAAATGSGAAGGNGHSQAGGDGGGGYSAIRVGSTTGALKAVAAGAGGTSGDGGKGGAGGGPTGGWGTAGTLPAPAKVLDGTNRAINPNLETNINGWSSNNNTNYPAVRDTTAPISGVASFMSTRTATAPSATVGSVYCTGMSSTSVFFPITPGVPITWSVDVKAEQTERRARLTVSWRDAGGAAIVGVAEPYTNLVAGVPTRLSAVATPPANAVGSYVSMQVNTLSGNALDGERCWFDNVRCSIGESDTSYFDGSTPASGPYSYRWTGTANASTSERLYQPPVPTPAPTGDATGGTPSQGGNGGTSSAGTQYNGNNAADTVVAPGGRGGEATAGISCHGGGGGGGGYRSGGGGQASAPGYAPAGGGGGGSDYTGGLTGAASTQGGGGTNAGSVSISWVTPPPANAPPNVPTAAKVNGVDEAPGMLTKSTTSVQVTATISDPNKKNVRLLARWSASPTFSTFTNVYSGWHTWATGGRATTVTLTGLSQNTHYYVRLYAQDTNGLYSNGYNAVDFWTNKAPLSPDGLTVNTQGSGMSLPTLDSATFAWMHNDENVADYQTAFHLQYRKSATSTTVAGAWTAVNVAVGQNLPPKVAGPPSSAKNEWVFNPGTFKGNTFYEWQVRTRDGQGLWGAWSLLFTFHATSTTTPPVLLTPRPAEPVDVHQATTFSWRFVDPDTGDRQLRADFRYRAIGPIQGSPTVPPPDWILLPGAVSPGTPGSSQTWVIPADTFSADYIYEWQVRTYDTSGGPPSDWADSFRFYAIDTPGSESGPLPIGDAVRPQGSLGCGVYRVFVYEQGGKRRLGELEPISLLRFTRLRDDISACTAFSSGYSTDCGALYASVRCWMHELVVFRDGVRVWEGPITRIAYTANQVEFEAKDVMAYVYRRVLRAGYNDAYRLIKAGVGTLPDQYLGLLSVVRRAAMLITQALAPYDPNVLPFLTTIEFPDDARESRVIADFSRSAWEEVDDLAATAGLDYTTVGRRILLWDTHRAIGRLPELRDGDFSDSPIVTEYGMQLATFFAVTNGSGVVGYASVKAGSYPYGPIEHLASSYSDAAAASAEIQTPEQLAKAQESMTEQAERNLTNRWPAPLIVRVPDNSTLSPEANVGFQQLIPGVWLPLRSVNTPRQVTQWQKLDSVAVEFDEKGERVQVVLSPAPNGGNDPDTDVGEEG